MSEETKDPNLDQDSGQVSEPEQADSSLSEDVVVSDEGQPQEGELLETSEGGEAVAAVESPHKGFLGKMDNYFGITRSGSTYRAEIIAGVTTFMAMCYILIVNAGFFETIIPSENAFGASYIATCIGAIVGTLLMAFVAKMPLAQASGMGVNAFICFTICADVTGLTYANAMVFTLLDGVIFLLLTVTGLRTKIFEAIPSSVRSAISVGIGLFIAYIGLQGAGFIVLDFSADVSGAITEAAAGDAMIGVEEAIGAATGAVDSAVGGSVLTGMVSFNILGTDFAFTDIIGPIVLLAGVIAIAIMSKKNVKGAVLWGILGSTALYYILHGISYAAGSEVSAAMFEGISMTNPFSAFAAWGTDAVGKVFTEGFKFGAYLDIEGNTVGSLVLVFITTAISLCMIDMFDTIGTLYGACERGGLLDKDGKPIRMERMMLADSIATCAGAVAGTSTVTTFVESSAGVAAGGRTGFTALIVVLLFVVAMFLSPIAQLIPSSATATALVWVGVLMMSSVTKINWKDPVDALVAFLTFIVMLLGYSISKGIGIGIIAYILIKLCSGKVKEIHVATWVIGALYLVAFLISPI